MSEDLEKLYGHVAEDVEDHERWKVLADKLTEDGDKRGEHIANDLFIRELEEEKAKLEFERKKVLMEFFGRKDISPDELYFNELPHASDWRGTIPLKLDLCVDEYVDHRQGVINLLNSDYGEFVKFGIKVDTKYARLKDAITEMIAVRIVELDLPNSDFLNEDADHLVKLGVQLKWLQAGGYLRPSPNLVFEKAIIGDKVMRTIANAECMANLEYLSFGTTLFSDHDAIELAESSCMRNLGKLNLYQTEVQDEGIYALMNSKNLPKLYYIDPGFGLYLSGDDRPDYFSQVNQWNEQRRKELNIT